MSTDEGRRAGMAEDDDACHNDWVARSVVSAVPVIDRLAAEDGMVLMVEAGAAHRVVRLSPLGRVILDAVGDETTLGGLESSLLEQVGPPPDGDLSSAVRAAVALLVRAGALRVAEERRM